MADGYVRPLPVRIHVSEAGAERVVTDGLDPLTAALVAHIQRIACEGARAAWCRAPVSRDWMEAQTGLTGWRAQINPDSAHLVHVMEELGIAEFDDA